MGGADHAGTDECDVVLRDAATDGRNVVSAWLAELRAPARDHRSQTGTEQRTLSVESMPYLLDHRFYRQRDGWSEVSDLFPVVPMTCTLGIFGEVASRLMPGRVVVGLEHVRALRWLAVEPPVDVTITATVA